MEHEDAYLMICDCESRESKLSDREREFIDSLANQYAKTGTMSDNQYQWLEQIWNRIT